jgi:hypothetical protein
MFLQPLGVSGGFFYAESTMIDRFVNRLLRSDMNSRLSAPLFMETRKKNGPEKSGPLSFIAFRFLGF